MPNFIITYRGRAKKPATQEEGAAHMKKWQAWMAGLGDAVLNPPGTPLGKSKLVSPSGVSDDAGENALSGYMIVKADDMDAAIEIAKTDPYIDMGGTVEVAQIMEME